MRTRVLHYNFFLIAFLLLTGNVFADGNPVEGMTAQKVKKIIRTYQVSSKDALYIDNKFGSVTVNTWDKNEFKVEITVLAIDDNDDKAQKQLDRVTISDSKVGSEVRFVTNIASGNSWNWKRGGDDKRKLEVNYVVNMPKSNHLSITNKYGSVNLPEFSGPFSLDLSYGNFTGGNLRSNENSLTVRYGSATIESIKKGSLDISYSKLNIQNGGELSIAHRYGSLDINEVDVISANIDYSSIRINMINQSGSIDSKYSSGVKLMNISRSLKSLVINSAYSGVNLGFADNAAFDFSVNVSYGDFGYDRNKASNITQSGNDEEKGWKPSKSFSGRYGSGSVNGKISISAKYGSVKFN